MKQKVKKGQTKNPLPEPELAGDYFLPGPKNMTTTGAKAKRYFNQGRHFFPPYIFFIISLYLVQMLIFLGFRLAFLFTNYQKIPSDSFKYMKMVLYNGFRFDTIVSCYILVLPFLFLSVDYFFEWNKHWFYKIIKIYLRTLLVISFLICAADIPFFAFFNSRLTTSALLWKNNAGAMMRFVLTDPGKYPYILLLMAASVVFVFTLVRLQGRLFNENINRIYHSPRQKSLVVIISSVILLIGMRGGLIDNPMNEKNLTSANHFFINQLSWNPILSFIDSFDGFPLDFLELEQALENAGRYLGSDHDFSSPIARKRTYTGIPLQANVVLVLMESMAATQMGQFGNTNNFTPNLDTLARQGLQFKNIYTAGLHTCNGVYGSLFSMPSLMNEHPMNNLQSTHQTFSGFYNTLSQHNYQTAFICTNDENFDNQGYFVKNNGCQYVYGMKSYPKNKIVNSWGPGDEVMFDLAIDKLNLMHENKEPFFATLLTISTHEPYVVPPYTSFKPQHTNPIDRLYEYADWSIGRFIESCKKQPWFENTIFVFVADHGINSNSPFIIPLSFHHSPLIIYSPGLIKQPGVYDQMGMQADIFPTIMGLLKIPYVNNTFGIDLLNEERPYAYFTHDDKLGCINKEYFLAVSKDGSRYLYRYRQENPTDCLNEKKSLADSMQTYSMSMLQTAQWMLLNRKAGIQYKLN